jgi:geranylgeranyl diphosphate synthase type II
MIGPGKGMRGTRDLMDFTDRHELEQAFAKYMPLPGTLEPHLRDGLLHVLSQAGSLTRPQMVFELSMSYGLSRVDAKELAIALEYFHTASLIFDDLPSMDDATERRGAECVHVKFGEATAMLAALAIINRAYALTWKVIGAAPAERRRRAGEYIEQHLGIGGLLNGQSLDLNYFALPHDLATTEKVALGKTVSLIQLTLVLPALIGGAPAREIQLLDRIARFWGLSYQIIDDLKDVLHSSNESGKTVSRDLHLDRPNTALTIGVAATVERLERLIRLGDNNLTTLISVRPSNVFLRMLRESLREETQRVVQSACEGSSRGTA